MPRVSFTRHLERFLTAPSAEVEASTVREALDAVFQNHPRLRGYVLDDQNRLRKHVNVFVGTERVLDREGLTDPVDDASEIFIMQALSGG